LEDIKNTQKICVSLQTNRLNRVYYMQLELRFLKFGQPKLICDRCHRLEIALKEFIVDVVGEFYQSNEMFVLPLITR